MKAARQAELRRLFLATSYGTPRERFGLGPARAGSAPPGWATRGAAWAIVTAWNPGGWQGDRARNEAAQRDLELLVRRSGCPVLDGVNGEGEWAEPSLIVLGASQEQAREWAASFGQAAALWGQGARAALVWSHAAHPAPEDQAWTFPLRPEPDGPDGV